MKTNNMSIPPCQSRNRASAALPLLANPSFFYGLLTLGFFALSPTLRAVTPAPDGGYPNNNTAEGEEALFKLNLSYGNNTALGYHALHEAIGTLFNTAVGASSLAKNQDGDDNSDSAMQSKSELRNVAVSFCSPVEIVENSPDEPQERS